MRLTGPDSSFAVQPWPAGDGTGAQQPGAPAGQTFRIASITKTFTAALCVLLHERRTFDLDQHVADGLALPNRRLAGATWRQVLQHRARFPLESGSRAWCPGVAPTPTDLLRAAARHDPVSVPGTGWHYSNFGYGLVGLALERITGASFEDLLDGLLLRPLGLDRTGLEAPDRRPYALGACAPAGEMWSCLADLLTWGQALAGHAPSVLPRSTLKVLLADPVPCDLRGSQQGLGIQVRGLAAGTALVTRGVLEGRSSYLVAMPGVGAAAFTAVRFSPSAPVDVFEELAAELVAAADAARPLLAPDRDVLGTWWLDGQQVACRRTGHGVALWWSDLPEPFPFLSFDWNAAAGCWQSVQDERFTVDGDDAGCGPLHLSRDVDHSAAKS